MSKTSLSILGLCGIAIVVAGYFFFHKGTAPEGMTQETSVLLYVEEGDVSYKNPDMGSFQKATTSPVVIVDGSKVDTGLGKATILFPNNSSTRLDHYTELTVSYKGDSISFFQTAGTTYHRVESVVTGGSYEVRTPGTLAAVRGTKFAVKYDKKSKVTKVAVTEHKVSVSKLTNGASTSTQETSENVVVEENTTASVSDTKHIDVIDTSTDIDMKAWVDENKGRDDKIDTIKSDTTITKDEVRTEIKKTITEDEASDTEENKTDEKTPEKDTSAQPKTDTTPTPKKESTPTPAPKQDTSTRTTPLSDEAFFDKFNDLFTAYFYLDEKDSTCGLKVTPAERVRVVTSYGVENGHAFTSGALLDFATSIQNYCDNKDAAVKAKLQTRFDSEYPFQEDI